MRAVWVSGGLALILAAATVWMVAPLSPGAVVLQFAWTPRAFGEIVHLWPPDDLARYRLHLPLDTALLLAYGSFGWLLATRTALFAALTGPGRAFARFGLPLAAVFDAAENAFHWWLTEVPRFDAPMTYLMSSACSACKWSLLLGFGALVLYALARSPD